MDKFYTRSDEGKNRVKLVITIPADAFTASYKMLLDQESKKVDIKGFRKGTVPSNLIEPQIKPSLLAQTFEKIAPFYVAQAIGAEKLDPVAPPEYSDLSELDTNKAISFTITVTLMPEFKLGDLKKINLKTEKIEANDEEVQKVLDQMKQNNKTKEKEVNDEWAVEVAKVNMLENVKTLSDLKNEIKNLLVTQKEVIQRREQEQKALKQAIELSKIEIPEESIHYEAHEREHSFMHELEHANKSFEEFAKSQGLTVEQIREMWHKDAKDALENDVFLKTYAKDRKLELSETELKESIEAIKASEDGKNADPKLFENPEWIEYIKSYLIKQKSYNEFLKETIGEYKASVNKKGQEKTSKNK